MFILALRDAFFQFIPVEAMSAGAASLINHATRWKWAVSFK